MIQQKNTKQAETNSATKKELKADTKKQVEESKKDDEYLKILGPNEKKIKKMYNKRIKKKERTKEQKDLRKLQNRIAYNEKHVFNFVDDFSSSDYEYMSDSDDPFNCFQQSSINKSEREKKASDNKSEFNQTKSSIRKRMNLEEKEGELKYNYLKFEQRRLKKPKKFYQDDKNKELFFISEDKAKDIDWQERIVLGKIGIKDKAVNMFADELKIYEEEERLSDMEDSVVESQK